MKNPEDLQFLDCEELLRIEEGIKEILSGIKKS